MIESTDSQREAIMKNFSAITDLKVLYSAARALKSSGNYDTSMVNSCLTKRKQELVNISSQSIKEINKRVIPLIDIQKKSNLVMVVHDNLTSNYIRVNEFGQLDI